ncbi:CotH kinase family protein [Klebsiella pneumoniae]|nr:CotH kinase family protein [Klebsiella pneumoniae]
MMTNITEKVQWSDAVYQISRTDRVEGGYSGVANIQARQLADRTQYLKAMMNSILDAKEYTFYISDNDPDGTVSGISATKFGQIFRVAQGVMSDASFIYYLNNNGNAVAIASLPSMKKTETNYNDIINVISALFTALQSGSGAVAETVSLAINSLAELRTENVEIQGRMQNVVLSILLGLQGAETAIAELQADKASESSLSEFELFRLYWLQTFGAQLTPLDGFDPQEVATQGDIKDLELFRLYWLQTFGIQLSALEGVDGDSIATKQELAELESKITGVTLEPVTQGIYVAGAPRGIVRIDLKSSGSIPSSKADGVVPGYVSVKIDGQSFGAYCDFGVQGASSALYAKKNLSFDLFADDAHKEEVKLAIGNVLPHETWVYKANWIDSTHIRNTMGYALWEQIVQSRRTWPKREVESVFIGKQGAEGLFNGANGHPVGYPCVVFFNGEFYGIGDIMTGKKRANYNLAKNAPLQIQLDIGGWLTFGDFSSHIADTNFVEFKAPKSPTSATYAAIDAWDAFCNLEQADFITALPLHLDKVNIIDYFLFTTFGNFTDCGAGNTIKNTQLITYDGVKWYFMPYDLDTCYGLQWDGRSISYPPTNPVRLNGDFWNKIRAAYGGDINARWAELRNNGIFSVSNVYALILDLQGKYSRDLFNAEFAKWPAVPSLGITGVDQVLTWIKDRLVFLDTQFSYTD